MNYATWVESVPRSITSDTLWKAEAYRLALFVADLGWHDVSKVILDKRTRGLGDQLYRAVGSIGANISEGYSRGTGRDRARFYEYALGSARETRGWYYNGRRVLGDNVTDHRIGVLTQIIRLLLIMVSDQRGSSLREDGPSYQVRAETLGLECLPSADELAPLLQTAPLP